MSKSSSRRLVCLFLRINAGLHASRWIWTPITSPGPGTKSQIDIEVLTIGFIVLLTPVLGARYHPSIRAVGVAPLCNTEWKLKVLHRGKAAETEVGDVAEPAEHLQRLRPADCQLQPTKHIILVFIKFFSEANISGTFFHDCSKASGLFLTVFSYTSLIAVPDLEDLR